MDEFRHPDSPGKPFTLRLGILCLASVLVLSLTTCDTPRKIQIAVIPQTDGIALWDIPHAAIEEAADRIGALIYWNAPTREDDVEAQISLVERVIDKNYQGLVLAPDQALALVSPVRRALARGIPTVIIGSPLAMPAAGNLYYILNDDEEGGRIAAMRIAGILHGRGTVAMLGINPDVAGIMQRARSFETYLQQNYPDIHVVEKHIGSFNVPHEQQIAEDTLRAHPNLDAIAAFMWSSTNGAMSAIRILPDHHPIKIVGFDATSQPQFDEGSGLDSVVQEDSRSMGERAIELIHLRELKQPVPGVTLLHPTLITSGNVNSAEVRKMFITDWQYGHLRWNRMQ